jgi:hypothetical protein
MRARKPGLHDIHTLAAWTQSVPPVAGGTDRVQAWLVIFEAHRIDIWFSSLTPAHLQSRATRSSLTIADYGNTLPVRFPQSKL